MLADEPVDIFGYDASWRINTVLQYDPVAVAGVSGGGDPPMGTPSGTIRVRERYFYHAAGDGGAAFGNGTVGTMGSDTPIMRLVDRTGDGDFNDYAEKQFFLANWRGDISAIMTPSMTPGQPGIVLAKVRYDAYGKPTIYHPADFDRDGIVGGSLSSEYTGELDGDQHDYGALEEALAYAPFSLPNTPTVVEPTLRAWRAFANISGLPPPAVTAIPEDWATWKRSQRDARFAASASLLANNLIATPSETIEWGEFFGNLPLYASYWFDAKLDLYHVRHRVYDPNHGRWLQRDPIGYAGGNNLYAYVGNGPHVGSDPSGLRPPGMDPEFDNATPWTGERAPGANALIDQIAILAGAAEAFFDAIVHDSDDAVTTTIAGVVGGLVEDIGGNSEAVREFANEYFVDDPSNQYLDMSWDTGRVWHEANKIAILRMLPPGSAGGEAAQALTGAAAAGRVAGQNSRHRSNDNRGYGQGYSYPTRPNDSVGVVYLRVNVRSNGQYVGQDKSVGRYHARQKEHARRNPNAEYEFSVLQLIIGNKMRRDVAEETHIRLLGGPSRYGGKRENHRWQMRDRGYQKNGGCEQSPPGVRRPR